MTIEGEGPTAGARFLTEFAVPIDLYFSAVTINLLTYLLTLPSAAPGLSSYATCVSHCITATEVKHSSITCQDEKIC